MVFHFFKILSAWLRAFVVQDFFGLLGLVFLSGCHPAALIIPSYVQLLGVDTFKNQTSYFGLETMLTEDTIRQFQVDGRVPVGDPDKSDLLIQLTIRKYDEEPIFYDTKTNAVLQYQLSLTYDLDAVDEREKKTFLEDTGKVHSVIFYTPQYTGAIAETKDAAVARLLQELSEIIVRRVLEGY